MLYFANDRNVLFVHSGSSKPQRNFFLVPCNKQVSATYSLDASRSLVGLAVLKVSASSSSASSSHTEEEAGTEQTGEDDNAHNDDDDQSVVSLLSSDQDGDIGGEISTLVSAQQSVGGLLLLSGRSTVQGSVLSINVNTIGKGLSKISILHGEDQLGTHIVGGDGGHDLILDELKISLGVAEGGRGLEDATNGLNQDAIGALQLLLTGVTITAWSGAHVSRLARSGQLASDAD